jgi:hypothetical protein
MAVQGIGKKSHGDLWTPWEKGLSHMAKRNKQRDLQWITEIVDRLHGALIEA